MTGDSGEKAARSGLSLRDFSALASGRTLLPGFTFSLTPKPSRKPELDTDAMAARDRLQRAETPTEEAAAIETLERIAEAGGAQAAYQLARVRLESRDFADRDGGISHLRRAAKLGLVLALIRLQIETDPMLEKHAYVTDPQSEGIDSYEIRQLFNSPHVATGLLQYYCANKPALSLTLAKRYWMGCGTRPNQLAARKLVEDYVGSGAAKLDGGLLAQAAAREAGAKDAKARPVEEIVRGFGRPADRQMQAADLVERDARYRVISRLPMGDGPHGQALAGETLLQSPMTNALPSPAILIALVKSVTDQPSIREAGRELAEAMIVSACEYALHVPRSVLVNHGLAAHLADTAGALSAEEWWAMYRILMAGHAFAAYRTPVNLSSVGRVASTSYRGEKLMIYNRSKYLEVEHGQSSMSGMGRSYIDERTRSSGGDFVCIVHRGKTALWTMCDAATTPRPEISDFSALTSLEVSDGKRRWAANWDGRERL